MPSWHFSLPAPHIPRPHREIRRFGDGWQGGFFKICSACERQDWSKRCAEMLAVTPYFEDLGTTNKPKKTAKAVATAAYPRSPSESAMLF